MISNCFNLVTRYAKKKLCDYHYNKQLKDSKVKFFKNLFILQKNTNFLLFDITDNYQQTNIIQQENLDEEILCNSLLVILLINLDTRENLDQYLQSEVTQNHTTNIKKQNVKKVSK